MQALGQRSAFGCAKTIFNQEGLKGLYRGGLPLVIGGAFVRSAQFGVYASVMEMEKKSLGASWGKEHRILGIFDPQVVLAGFAGGIGRGIH